MEKNRYHLAFKTLLEFLAIVDCSLMCVDLNTGLEL